MPGEDEGRAHRPRFVGDVAAGRDLSRAPALEEGAPAIGLGIFLGGTLLTVALVNQGGEETAWVAIGGQVGLSVALGFLVNRWWVIALSWLPVVIGLPFGYTEWVAGTDADPVWIRELFAWPVYVVAITAGVVIRRTIASRGARASSGQVS